MNKLFARFGHGFMSREAELVWAGGIAMDLFSGLEPGFPGLAHDGRGGIVIEIMHRRV
mgnify:CR=1 FL=1